MAMNARIDVPRAAEYPPTSAPGVRFCHGGRLGPQAALRQAVAQAPRLPEDQALASRLD